MNHGTRPALFAAFLLCALAACGTRVTLENYGQLKAGMTVEQVEALLGAGTEVDPTPGMLAGANAPKKLRWSSGSAAIQVTFVDGRLRSMSKEGL